MRMGLKGAYLLGAQGMRDLFASNVPKAMTIACSDSGAGAGILADLQTIHNR